MAGYKYATSGSEGSVYCDPNPQGMQTAGRHVRGQCGLRCKRAIVPAAAVRPLKLQHEPSLKKKAVKSPKKRPQACAVSSAVVPAAKDLSNDCRRTEQRDDPVDYAAECVRLREQLELVLLDHQRQSEEIVALRALAKALKNEVEAIHGARQQLHPPNEPTELHGQRGSSHEFFKLDLQIEGLRIENETLTQQLQRISRESQDLRAMLAHQLPRYKLHAVQARAELQSVMSQLREEQAHSDKLRAQLVRLKARSVQRIHVAPPRLDSGQASDKRTSMASVSSISNAWNNAISLQADMDHGDPGTACGAKESVQLCSSNSDRSSVQPRKMPRALAPGSPPGCADWLLPEDGSLADLVSPLTQLEHQLSQLHSALDGLKGATLSKS